MLATARPARLTVLDASAATRHSLIDEEQDNRAQDGGDPAADIEECKAFVAEAQQSSDKASDERADDADDNVHQQTLLRIRAHDHACDPSGDATKDKPGDNTHVHPP